MCTRKYNNKQLKHRSPKRTTKNMTLYQEEGLQGHDNTTKEKERIEKRMKVCIIEHVAPSSGQVRALMLFLKQYKLSSNVCRKQMFS